MTRSTLHAVTNDRLLDTSGACRMDGRGGEEFEIKSPEFPRRQLRTTSSSNSMTPSTPDGVADYRLLDTSGACRICGESEEFESIHPPKLPIARQLRRREQGRVRALQQASPIQPGSIALQQSKGHDQARRTNVLKAIIDKANMSPNLKPEGLGNDEAKMRMEDDDHAAEDFSSMRRVFEAEIMKMEKEIRALELDEARRAKLRQQIQLRRAKAIQDLASKAIYLATLTYDEEEAERASSRPKQLDKAEVERKIEDDGQAVGGSTLRPKGLYEAGEMKIEKDHGELDLGSKFNLEEDAQARRANVIQNIAEKAFELATLSYDKQAERTTSTPKQLDEAGKMRIEDDGQAAGGSSSRPKRFDKAKMKIEDGGQAAGGSSSSSKELYEAKELKIQKDNRTLDIGSKLNLKEDDQARRTNVLSTLAQDGQRRRAKVIEDEARRAIQMIEDQVTRAKRLTGLAYDKEADLAKDARAKAKLKQSMRSKRDGNPPKK